MDQARSGLGSLLVLLSLHLGLRSLSVLALSVLLGVKSDN
jgi:hypothetical protein